MKKVISIFALSALFLSSFYSCKNEEEDLFDQTSALRLEAAKKNYAELLSSADNGWAMEYFATDKYKGYLMLVKFNKDGSIKIAANDDLTNNRYTEEEGSLYELIADNGPVLTFNSSTNLLHRFSAPEDIPGTKEDEKGTGYGGDYEFIMVSPISEKDNILMKGKKNGVYIQMIRLNEDQNWEDYFAKQSALKNKLFGSNVNPVLLSIADKNFEIHDISTGISRYIPEGGDLITDSKERSVVLNSEGFRLITPITENGHTVQNFVYDENEDIFTCPDDPEVSIKGIAKFPFMWQQMTLAEKPKTWTFTPSSVMSDKFAAAMQPIIDEFRKISYTVSSFTFQVNNENNDLILRIAVRTNRGSSLTGNYYYAVNGNNDELTTSYKDSDNYGNSFLIYGLDSFVKEIMSQDFLLEANQSNMNLSTIKLVSKSDLDSWVLLTLK